MPHKKPRFYDPKALNDDPLEKVIEAKVRRYALAKGCLCYKFTSPSQRSVPDRLVITPGGTVLFLELKRKGKKPTPQQEHELGKLRGHNCLAYHADSFESAARLIDEALIVDIIKQL